MNGINYDAPMRLDCADVAALTGLVNGGVYTLEVLCTVIKANAALVAGYDWGVDLLDGSLHRSAPKGERAGWGQVVAEVVA